ncbi:uncharacterized protein J7T54_001928 [Emericellopsis cladophorae]|uniref:Fatty acid hydroxylase domain-containing protein n=1 Tax=Emericellopsis cladophorae TaxID=2686198 RepID=A0A9P9XVF7_9HYPO|nr:uncharacterized protein J7T54_001928 [Emericellopsis cladophorae]KAI6778124.1 hypothetical protein J7T54_001928 [Emericellopsis cladophorae]
MFSPAQTIRAILAPVLLTSLLFPSLYQPFLDSTWSTLRYSSFYNWSTFETIWTVFCYAAIEVSMTIVFLRHPEWRLSPSPSSKARAKPKGMRRPSRRIGEILLYIAPLLTMDLTMIKKFADVPLADILSSGNYDAHALLAPPDDHVLLAANASLPSKSFLLPTLHNFTASSPLQLVRALPPDAPSSRRLATELMASFLIYDTLFFAFHLSLHQIRPLRRWHAPHHSHDTGIHPQVTNQLSVFERLGLVLLANFSLNIIGSHVLTRTLFVPVFVWLLVEIHSGMDLPWGYDKVLPQGWAGGARTHMKHHAGGGGGLEPFFCWWDRLWEVCR